MDNEFFLVICVKVDRLSFLVRGAWPPEIVYTPNAITNLQKLFGEKLRNQDNTIAFTEYGFAITLCRLNCQCTDYVAYKMLGMLVEVVFEKLVVRYGTSGSRAIMEQQPSTSVMAPPCKLTCFFVVFVFFVRIFFLNLI